MLREKEINRFGECLDMPKQLTIIKVYICSKLYLFLSLSLGYVNNIGNYAEHVSQVLAIVPLLAKCRVRHWQSVHPTERMCKWAHERWAIFTIYEEENSPNQSDSDASLFWYNFETR